MNPRELTLQQMEEREANRIAFQKAKAEKAIAKLSERLKDKDENETERLQKIIGNHSSYKAELEATNVATIALSKYTAIQNKLKLRTDIKEEPLIVK